VKQRLVEAGGIVSDAGPSGQTGFRELYGGRLALDLANTVEPRAAEPNRDNLRSYADLVGWARHAGALDAATAGRLRQAADADPAAARRSLDHAVDLREAVYRAFAAVAAGDEPADVDLERMQRAYAAAMRGARLRPAAGRFALTWTDELDRAWWPVAVDALDLATAGPLDRIKQCPGPSGCGFLFLDASRNRSRRWCSMTECGGQTKARRQTARRRASRGT
jgi:predicted RNA-binding Zn ribbon-like protein